MKRAARLRHRDVVIGDGSDQGIDQGAVGRERHVRGAGEDQRVARRAQARSQAGERGLNGADIVQELGPAGDRFVLVRVLGGEGDLREARRAQLADDARDQGLAPELRQRLVAAEPAALPAGEDHGARIAHATIVARLWKARPNRRRMPARGSP